jgi:hypothetical protein
VHHIQAICTYGYRVRRSMLSLRTSSVTTPTATDTSLSLSSSPSSTFEQDTITSSTKMDTIVATFDINKLVAGTQEHLIYHQKRRYAEQKASSKINAPPETKESKKQWKEYNDRSRLTGFKLQYCPVNGTGFWGLFLRGCISLKNTY